MLCSNCGKDIPVLGNVCHWCGANKQNDQNIQIFGILFGFAGIFVGGALGLIFSGFGGAVVMGFIGAIVGTGFGYFATPRV